VKLQGHGYIVVPQCYATIAPPRKGKAIRLADELPLPFSCSAGVPVTNELQGFAPPITLAPTFGDCVPFPSIYEDLSDRFVDVGFPHAFMGGRSDATSSPPTFEVNGPVCDAILPCDCGLEDRADSISSTASTAVNADVVDVDNLDWDTAFPETACRSSAKADMVPHSLPTPVPTTPTWLYCSTPSLLSPCPVLAPAVSLTPTPHRSSPADEVMCSASVFANAPWPLSPVALTPSLLFCATPALSSSSPSDFSFCDEKTVGQRQWLEPTHIRQEDCSDKPASLDGFEKTYSSPLENRMQGQCELLVKNGFYHIPMSSASASGAVSRTLSLPKNMGMDRNVSQDDLTVFESKPLQQSREATGKDPHLLSFNERRLLWPPRKDSDHDECRIKASALVKGRRSYPRMPPRWNDDDDFSAATEEAATKELPLPSPAGIASPSSCSSPCSIELAQSSQRVMRLAELVC